jgi:alcohol dehydrogenase (cytochrome c)
MVYQGTPRKLLLEANRNGFLYILDRTNGKFLSATQFSLKQNWAQGIDKNGRPIRTDLMPDSAGTRICPGYAGATNWFSPSYSEATHLFYFMSLEECSVYAAKTEQFKEGKGYYSTGAKRSPSDKAEKILIAFDPVSHHFVWRIPQAGSTHSFAGVMTTATGLVLFGDDSNSFEAIDGRTGKPLWHFNMGQNAHASPMAYAVDGKQYFAIAAGNDLFAFALPD